MARNLELTVSSHTNDEGLRAAAREVDRLARAADDLGDQFRQAERAAGSLDRKLAETTLAAAALAKEFNRTGDSGIKKELDVQRKAASELKRLRADIVGDAEKNAKAATKAFESATKDFEKLSKKAGEDSATIFENGFREAITNPKVLAIGGTIGALLAIPIGAAIGGAVLAGAGAGAAGLAGFAAAKADQSGRVAAAGNDLLATVNKQITTGGQSAIGPLLAGIKELKAGLADVHLDRTIESAAKFIQPLAAGAARFATYIAQAGQDLVDAGGPAVKVLAEELPALGRAVKAAADAIASGGEGGARALQDFLRWLEAVITTTGQVIGLLEKAYGAIRSFGDGFESFLQKAHDANILLAGLVYPAQQLLDIFDSGKPKAEQYAHSLNNAAHDAEVLADQAKKTAEEVQQIGSAFQNLGQSTAGALTNQILQSMFALDEATLNFQESLNGLNDAVKENGKNLQGNSEKALRNKEALLSAAEANAALYAQNLLAGDSAEVAGQKYEANAATLRKQAIAAGYNAQQVDALVGKYGQVPEKVQTILATIGLTDALNHLGQILVDFRNLDDKTFQTKYFVDTYYRDYGGRVGGGEAAHHQLPPGHRAGGGPVVKGMPYIVGERRPEVFVPKMDGMILPSVPKGITAAQPNVTSMWGGTGSGPQAITVTVNFAGNTNSAFATAFMKLVRNGDIQIS